MCPSASVCSLNLKPPLDPAGTNTTRGLLREKTHFPSVDYLVIEANTHVSSLEELIQMLDSRVANTEVSLC